MICPKCGGRMSSSWPKKPNLFLIIITFGLCYTIPKLLGLPKNKPLAICQNCSYKSDKWEATF